MFPGPGYPEAEPPEPSQGFAAGDRGDGGPLGAEAGDGEGFKKSILILVETLNKALDAVMFDNAPPVLRRDRELHPCGIE